MTPIEIKDYNLIWMECSMKSLANVTRQDGVELLSIAEKIQIKTEIEVFPFEKLQDALILTKNGRARGHTVVKFAD